MDQTAYFGRPSDPFATARGARVRRMLLEQVRYALTTEPGALEISADGTPDSLTYIRGRVSITVGAIVVRLNQEGFTQSDRLYDMRDGRPRVAQHDYRDGAGIADGVLRIPIACVAASIQAGSASQVSTPQSSTT